MDKVACLFSCFSLAFSILTARSVLAEKLRNGRRRKHSLQAALSSLDSQGRALKLASNFLEFFRCVLEPREHGYGS